MTSSPPPDTEPVPYREVTDEAYAVFAAANFTVEKPHPDTLVLRGPCPRCGAVIDVPVVRSLFRTSRSLFDAFRRPAEEPLGDQVEPVVCTCGHDHPQRPSDRFGCGAYWTLVIEAGSW